jgi:hypothetical protein
MRKLLITVLLAVSIPAVAQADPIIPNAGFELGNAGFTSGYTYRSNLVPEGSYYIDSGSVAHNMYWTQNVTAHSGSEFMIVNGDGTAGVTVYDARNIAVLANTQYYFSAWVTALYPVSPAILQFSINGAALNSPLTISSNVGVWQELYVPWFSGSATTADISLLNENTVLVGNDFGMDDLALSTTVPDPVSDPDPVPEPLTLSIFGAGLAGVAGVAALRRRKKAKS